MDHIKAELARLNEAIQREPPVSDRRGALYAAQQALAWALEPDIAASPWRCILTGQITGLPACVDLEGGWRNGSS